MTDPTRHPVKFGRCRCRCECPNPATLRVKYYCATPGIRTLLARLRARWTFICLDCAPHMTDQIEETGRIWTP